MYMLLYLLHRMLFLVHFVPTDLVQWYSSHNLKRIQLVMVLFPNLHQQQQKDYYQRIRYQRNLLGIAHTRSSVVN